MWALPQRAGGGTWLTAQGLGWRPFPGRHSALRSRMVTPHSIQQVRGFFRRHTSESCHLLCQPVSFAPTPNWGNKKVLLEMSLTKGLHSLPPRDAPPQERSGRCPHFRSSRKFSGGITTVSPVNVRYSTARAGFGDSGAGSITTDSGPGQAPCMAQAVFCFVFYLLFIIMYLCIYIHMYIINTCEYIIYINIHTKVYVYI